MPFLRMSIPVSASEFMLDERDTRIDYTTQYLLTLPIPNGISDKSRFLRDLVPTIQEKLRAELKADDDGEFRCFERLRFHLREIKDGDFFEVEFEGNDFLECTSCHKQNPPEFHIRWMCGHGRNMGGKAQAYVNIFIELTVGVLIDDLVEYQYDEGPIDY